MSLREVEVGVTPPYVVRIGPGALATLDELAAPFGRRAVLTDERVEELHVERLGELLAAPRLALEPGEETKDLTGLGHVLDFLSSAGLGRDGLLVTLGGGVISDLGGLAASLYMRGIAVVHCPTTLLAQVDASVGGKTAVNLRAGKNLAGTFHQPRAVLADTSVLESLPADEYRCGLGEVLKSGLLQGEELFGALERDAARVLARDATLLCEVVHACVQLKARIVSADEREGGARRALNLGHTFAHAIEHCAGYGRIPHGVAVAVGLSLALQLSHSEGCLEEHELPARLTGLLATLELPATLEELRRSSGAALAPAQLWDAMQLDKKRGAEGLRWVLLRALGRPAIDQTVAPQRLQALLL